MGFFPDLLAHLVHKRHHNLFVFQSKPLRFASKRLPLVRKRDFRRVRYANLAPFFDAEFFTSFDWKRNLPPCS
jgi:hypothetical protein